MTLHLQNYDLYSDFWASVYSLSVNVRTVDEAFVDAQFAGAFVIKKVLWAS
jgi:hypothetical protein